MSFLPLNYSWEPENFPNAPWFNLPRFFSVRLGVLMGSTNGDGGIRLWYDYALYNRSGGLE